MPNNRFLRISLLSLAALVISGCTIFPPTSKAIQEPSEVVFGVTNQNMDYYQRKAEEFKLIEPNITITLKDVSLGGIDVREINIFSPEVNGDEDSQEMLDLAPFMQQDASFDRDDFFPGLLDALSRGGEQLAIPIGLDPFVLFYNRDLFDQKGIAYPAPGMNWEEFRTIALQLRDPEAHVYGYIPLEGYIDAIFFAFQHGAVLIDGSRPQLDSIEAIQALEWYAGLFSEYGAAPTAEKAREEFGGRGMMAGVFRGLGGMWISSYSSLGWLESDRVEFKIGVAPLPQDQTAYTIAYFNGLSIAPSAAYPEASWRWVLYLSTQPQPWYIPARRSVIESDAYAAEFGRPRTETAMQVIQDVHLITSFSAEQAGPVQEAYLRAVAQTVDGLLPPELTLAEAQESIMP